MRQLHKRLAPAALNNALSLAGVDKGLYVK